MARAVASSRLSRLVAVALVALGLALCLVKLPQQERFQGELRFVCPTAQDVEGVTLGETKDEAQGFTVRVEALGELAPSDVTHTLQVSAYGETITQRLVIGEAVDLGGASYTVESFRPWHGLVRYASGAPYASLSLRDEDRLLADRVAIASDAWRIFDTRLAVYCKWFDRAEAMEAAASTALPGIESARWGLREGPAAHWSSAFILGSVLTRSDGSTVTLLRYSESYPLADGPAHAIQVRDSRSEATQWVAANAPDEAAEIRFEHPASAERVVRLFFSADDEALLQYFTGGVKRQEARVAAGESWTPAGASLTFRLDQALATALAVEPQHSNVVEAVLSGAERRLSLRQGEAVRIGDAMVQYGQTVWPRRIKYRVTLLRDSPGPIAQLEVETPRRDDPRLSPRVQRVALAPDFPFARALEIQAHTEPGELEEGVVVAVRQLDRIMGWPFGALLLLGASALWAASRALRPPQAR